MKTLYDDHRNRFIQLGCGQQSLPSPWENYDHEVDIRRPLPFAGESTRFLFAEHVIEHVPFAEGLGFLKEAYRVLQPGGTLRLCFPDVTRFDSPLIPVEEAEARCAAYLKWMATKGGDANLGHTLIYRAILSGFGHKSAWSAGTGEAALTAVGFPRVWECFYGDSEHPELRNIERHHFTVPESVAIAETTILEATK